MIGKTAKKFLITTMLVFRVALSANGQSPHLVIPIGHETKISAVAFSKNGKVAATGSADGSIKIWNVDEGMMLGDLTAHKSPILELVFEDNKTLRSTSEDGMIFTWDLLNLKVLKQEQRKADKKPAIYVSPDKRFTAAIVNDTIIKLTRAGKPPLLLKGHGEKINSVSFSHDSKWIVSTSAFYSIKIWETSNGQLARSFSCQIDVQAYKAPSYCRDAEWAIYSPDDDFIFSKLLDGDGSSIEWYSLRDAKTGTSVGYIDGAAAFSSDGRSILIGNGEQVEVWSTRPFRKQKTLSSSTASGRNLFHSTAFYPCEEPATRALPQGNFIFDTTRLHLPEQDVQFKPEGPYYYISMSPDSTLAAYGFAGGPAFIWNAVTGKFLYELQELTHETSSVAWSHNSKMFKTYSRAPGFVCDALTGQPIVRISSYISTDFTKDDKRIAYYNSASNSICVYDLPDRKELHSTKLEQDKLIRLSYQENEKYIVGEFENGLVMIWDSELSSLLYKFNIGENRFQYICDDKWVVTLNYLGKNFFGFDGQKKITFIPIDTTDWIALHPSGLFDASPGAMEKLYWVKGTEIIDFNQLKERYWQPGLWRMIMSGAPLRSVDGMADLKLQPEVQLDSLRNNQLTIHLKKRDGGYGKVSVFVNGKEVIADARPRGFDSSRVQQQITLPVGPYLASGCTNDIRVKAWSRDGFVSSRGVGVRQTVAATSKGRPAFYAIICGTGQFSNPTLTLKYPVADAAAIAKAVELAATRLFGKDSTHIQLLSSPGATATTKANIRAAFANLHTQAKANDVVVVYLSGHGITWGGDKGDFYYLTTEASSTSAESFSDPALRNQQTISTAELTQWLNESKALKQVLILDACGSGKAVDNLIARRDIDPSQIKAIDRMRDRTGLYVISGCAADAVSYEASRYGQGLLTYALLQAMKGARLRESKYVDISQLLEYARDEVPKMAMGIGGIQQPQLLYPKAGSFDIGMLDEEAKARIPLASIKPVFIRTTVLDEERKRDVLRIGAGLNEKLNLLATRGAESPIVFVDAEDFPDACSISGTYVQQQDGIHFTGSVSCGGKERGLSLVQNSREALIEAIAGAALNP